MGFGIRKSISRLSVGCTIFKFRLLKFFFGFNAANQKLLTCRKESIIPLLQANGALIGNDCDIETNLQFHNCQNYNNLRIGNHCHIGKNTFFDLKEKILIDDRVTISMGTMILSHLDVGKSLLSDEFNKESKPVIIKNDVYIGAGSTILMGVELAEKIFVASGSVVTKSFPANILVGGVPARLIKKLSADDLDKT